MPGASPLARDRSSLAYGLGSCGGSTNTPRTGFTDAIASYLHDARAKREEFQVWQLAVDGSTRRAVLSMTDGNSTKPIITQAIDHTDFPLDEITLWLVASGNHRVLMLPSEY